MAISTSMLFAAFASIAAFAYLPYPPGSNEFAVLKTLPAVFFALSAFAGSSAPDAFGRNVGLGLLFAGLGDYYLALMTDSYFLCGMAAFALGHVCFSIAFSQGTRLHIGRGLVVFSAAAAALSQLYAGLGEFRIPVIVYSATLATTVWRAAARIGLKEKPYTSDAHAVFVPNPSAGLYQWLATFGAVSFLVSDLTIAIDKFMGGAGGNHHSLFIMATYWFALFAFSVSVRRFVPKRKD